MDCLVLSTLYNVHDHNLTPISLISPLVCLKFTLRYFYITVDYALCINIVTCGEWVWQKLLHMLSLNLLKQPPMTFWGLSLSNCFSLVSLYLFHSFLFLFRIVFCWILWTFQDAQNVNIDVRVHSHLTGLGGWSLLVKCCPSLDTRHCCYAVTEYWICVSCVAWAA